MEAETELRQRFIEATDSFVEKVKIDPNVIAVIICGSLAYDTVWERSDIDTTLIVREQVLKKDSYCILEDDITINVNVMTRSAFKRSMERVAGGSFSQAYFAKGKIVYSNDDSLYDYFEEMKYLGSDDIALSVLFHACELVYLYDKSRKWLTVRKDPLYAQYYLILAANAIARTELCLIGEPPTREAVIRAAALKPELIRPYYEDAMSHRYSEEEISRGIEGIDRYLKDHLDIIKKPVIEYMKDQELKTVTLLSRHFRLEGHFLIEILDYLAEQGVIAKVSQTIRITPKSKRAVEEIAYVYLPDMEGV